MPDPTLLTAAHLRELLDYDRETGGFTWRVYRGKSTPRPGERAGHHCKRSGYVYIRIDTVLWRAHRLAWLHVTGEHPPRDIDHWDTNRSNNAWRNLRLATNAQNSQNERKPRSQNKTGYLGVFYRPDRGNYVAQIKSNGKAHHLGTFPTAEAAHEVYLDAKRRLHEFCTI